MLNRKIMSNCEGTEQLPRYSTLGALRAKANRKPQLRIHKGNEHSMKLHILETNGQFFLLWLVSET